MKGRPVLIGGKTRFGSLGSVRFHGRPEMLFEGGLPRAGENGGAGVGKRNRRGDEFDIAAVYSIPRKFRIADINPIPLGELRLVENAVVDRLAFIHDRPAVLPPPHLGEHGLAPEQMMPGILLAEAVENVPPVSIFVFDEITVPQSLEPVRLPVTDGMGENRIVRTALEGTFSRTAPGDDRLVPRIAYRLPRSGDNTTRRA